MKSKYKGIDEREIKCCCVNSENCIESGISFDENILRFHFLEYITEKKILTQKTKLMYLNKESIQDLIKKLKSIKFKK